MEFVFCSALIDAQKLFLLMMKVCSVMTTAHNLIGIGGIGKVVAVPCSVGCICNTVFLLTTTRTIRTYEEEKKT